jgi:transposase
MDQDQVRRVTLADVSALFPSDDECLVHVMEVRFGKRHVCKRCRVYSSFHKLSGYRAFSCARCGFHIFPCSRTLLHGSSKPLHLWFYTIYAHLMGQAVATPELQKTLGVNYRTARRMNDLVREAAVVPREAEFMRRLIKPLLSQNASARSTPACC